MISIVVADDHGIVREGVRRLIESEDDLEVCGEASGARGVLAEISRAKPDLIVLDITIPRLGGLEVLERIRADHSDTRVILFSTHQDAHFIRSAIALGVDGFVPKDGPSEAVIEAIREVMRGGRFFGPLVERRLAEPLEATNLALESEDPLTLLSLREREVLHLVADGHSAKEIAAALSISPKTVEAHRSSLMRKVGVHKATELVRYAIRHGLIEP
jgi:DNA-binding NarL/FixJ family response regulator